MGKLPVIWAPHKGAQRKFMTCPVWECLLHGNRGGGKTDVLLMDYAQGVGRGYGSDYRGLLLREATTELGDVIAKANKWFPKMFPGAKYNEARKVWKFPQGESLWFNYARVLSDYDQYHGHEYPWIGWEELTNHAVDEVYLKLMSCNRSSNPLIPKKYRATCNPSGAGHGWVKLRFIDSIPEGKVLRENMMLELPNDQNEMVMKEITITRTHLFSDLKENTTLLKADPMYKAKLLQMTQDNEMLKKAWIDGAWDLIIGGFFTDVWEPRTHILPNFPIPKSWKCIRSFDWGSSKPWCVTYFVEANGEQPVYVPTVDFPYIPKGSVIVINEIYGWTGKPNEGDMALSQTMAERILAMDEAIKIEYGLVVQPGPADTSIYDVKDGQSIGMTMASFGVHWLRAHKGSGSRVSGWSLLRQMLGAAKRRELEAPHLYFLRQAQHHIRVLPLMQRDPKKPEDIDTDLEDHCFHYDTGVVTDKGTFPIGDLVGTSGSILSIDGVYKKYTNCRLVSKNVPMVKVTFLDGTEVLCTEDHLFLTTKGFVKAEDLLTLSDTLCIVSGNFIHKEKLWKESKSYQIRNKSFLERCTTCVESIFKKKVQDFIKLFGNTLEGTLKKDSMSIINIVLPKIKLKIWNYFKALSTCLCMESYRTEKVFQEKPLLQPQNGIKVKMDQSGIRETMKKLKIFFMKKLKGFVNIANPNISVVEKTQCPFVPISVNQLGEENQELITSKGYVKFAHPNFILQNTQEQKHVLVNVERNCALRVLKIEKVGKYDSYCLEVPDNNTFSLSNGILVSNCMDSLRYGISRKMMSLSMGKVGM